MSTPTQCMGLKVAPVLADIEGIPQLGRSRELSSAKRRELFSALGRRGLVPQSVGHARMRTHAG